MQRTFKPEVGQYFFALILLLSIALIYFLWIQVIWMTVLLLIADTFMIKMFLKTEYVIEDGILTLKSGYFPEIKIKIEDIIFLEHSRSLWGIYAHSVDRLKIVYGEDIRRDISVSPKDKTSFIRELKKYNSEIICPDENNLK